MCKSYDLYGPRYNHPVKRSKARQEKYKRDTIGKKFGHWTVLEYIREKKGYKVRCDCGKIGTYSITLLKNSSKKACRACSYKINTMPNKTAAKREALGAYKRQAKNRGLCFELSENEFFGLIISNCYYCGAEPSNKFKKFNDFKYNGVDRKDNLIGYTVDNCVACCATCNLCKRNLSSNEWVSWVNRLINSEWVKNNCKKGR